MKKIIFLVFLLALIPLVSAEVCCEKTIDNQYCILTDESNCDPNYRSNAASCEQTSYCKVGCCFSSDEGNCFKNTPEAACTQQEFSWTPDPNCNNAQCTKGCCTIGPESFFVTETKCKQVTSKYEDVSMSFDDSITTEKECLDKSRSQDLGCCVDSDACSFTTRENCNAAEETNATQKQGFFKGALCSNDKLSCSCAKQHHTECFGEDVYWFDSCGNRENIYDADKAKSYNNGYVLTESQSCQTDDIDCGNCDYIEGTICGNSTKKTPQYGSLICQSTKCKNTYQDKYSPNSGGTKRTGESWCLYDGPVGQGRDLVGSLHYRSLCINGEEIIESCRDFREEICIQNSRNEPPPETLQSFGIKEGYVEAACRENRWQDCNSCNDLENCGAECDGLPDPNLNTDENEAVKACCAKKCCEDEVDKDCYWAEYGISPFLTKAKKDMQGDLKKQGAKGDSAQITNILSGVCVPQVPPGTQFWSSDVEPVESSTRTTTRSIFDVTGRAEQGSEFLPDKSEPTTTEKKSVPTTGTTVTGSSSGDVCSQATMECEVTFKRGLFKRIGGVQTIAGSGFKCIKNCHCMTKEWVVAANNFCKTQGGWL